MKIVFVSEHYPSKEHTQYCVYLQQQALALIQLGHEVEVIRLLKGVECMSEEILAGIKIYNVCISNRIVDKIYANYRSRLAGKIDWRKYDVVSIHIVSVPFASVIVSDCCKVHVPVVFHFHGLNVWEDYYKKNTILHKLLHTINLKRKLNMLRRCKAIVGVSKGVCEVVRTRLQQPKSYLVYNGVDIEKFPRTEKNTSEAGVFCILCVANYIPIKGQSYLIKAIYELTQSGRNVMLNLIGQGPDEIMLKSLTHELRLNDRVSFLGLKPYEDVYRYMSLSDMFIMPSFYDSFGCVYVEAMSTGTVTCGCDVYGPKEIIEDGVSGLLVKPKSVESIVEAVKTVMDNPDLRKKLEQNAIKRAARFSWHQSAKELEKVYKDSIANP